MQHQLNISAILHQMKPESMAMIETWLISVMKLYSATSNKNHISVDPATSPAETLGFLHRSTSATARSAKVMYQSDLEFQNWVWVFFYRLIMSEYVPFLPPRILCIDLLRPNGFCNNMLRLESEWFCIVCYKSMNEVVCLAMFGLILEVSSLFMRSRRVSSFRFGEKVSYK